MLWHSQIYRYFQGYPKSADHCQLITLFYLQREDFQNNQGNAGAAVEDRSQKEKQKN